MQSDHPQQFDRSPRPVKPHPIRHAGPCGERVDPPCGDLSWRPYHPAERLPSGVLCHLCGTRWSRSEPVTCRVGLRSTYIIFMTSQIPRIGGCPMTVTEQSGPRSTLGRGKAADTIALGKAAHAVLEGSAYAMTLRQLYYAMVASGAIAKTDTAYRKLARVMREMREAGAVPWDWLVDHTRAVFAARTFDGIEGLLADSARACTWQT